MPTHQPVDASAERLDITPGHDARAERAVPPVGEYQSQALFEATFRKAPIALIVVDQRGRIRLFNERAEAMFKYPSEDIVGAPVEMLINASLRSRHTEMVRGYFADPTPRMMGEGRNLYGVDRMGSEIPIEVGLNPIRLDDEILVMASIIDITTRQKIEARFQNAIEAAPVAMLMVNEQRQIMLVNQEALKLFGYARHELLNQELEILIPADVRDRHPQLVAQFLNNPMPRRMGEGRRLYGVTKSGEKIRIEVGLSPLETAEERFVVTSIIDISRQVEQEAKFEVAVEAAPNAMVMVDARGTITLVNQQCEDLFQYSRDELVGEPIERLVPDHMRERHPSLVKHFVNNPEPRSMGSGRDLFAQKKDGTLFPVEVGLRPISTKDGVQVISSIVDITERVNDKKLILARNEELQQFAYRASHDLRAPLISISGLAEIAEECLSEQPEVAAEHMTRIASLARRLKDFIQDIMALAKADHTEVDAHEFDFEAVVQGIREKLETVIEQTAVEIEYRPGHSRSLVTDVRRLNQVLENLVSNAIKYASPERDPRFVRITTYNDNRHFHLTVADNGIGIPEEHWPRVFQMFQRFHPDHTAGSGLGLYLVKRYVDQIGGQISFESGSQGTQFFLQLPLCLPGQVAVAEPAQDNIASNSDR